MPHFSESSRKRLETTKQDLQTLFNEVIKYYDCTILCGHRNEFEQKEAFREKKSQLSWPNSKHNTKPSLAIDVAPYPIDWNDIQRFCYFAGFIEGIAETLYERGEITHRIRWGGDWNMNGKMSDENFRDLVHFEQVPRQES